MTLTKKVLVISDDAILLELLNNRLGKWGLHMATVKGNGQDLKTVVDREQPDFAIIDVMMPSMEGIALCLYFRQCSQIPIIMLSTWGAGKGKVRGLDLSAEGYLTEPFDISELTARMEEAFQRSEAFGSLPSGVGR